MRTVLLSNKEINQRINRLAYQVYEDNPDEKEIILAGILQSGFKVAQMLNDVIQRISALKTTLVKVEIDKHSQVEKEIKISIPREQLSGKTIILIDDVLNSGKTMMYALKPFLNADIRKVRTVVLVDRNHRRYPVATDFSGLTLSTTLKEHVSVEFTGDEAIAYLD